MAKIFNIGGPCNPATHYMLPPAGRMPEVASLIDDGAYFVVHAPRQSGKTTMFLGLAREINAKGEKAAVYCTVETVQEFADPESALPKVAEVLRQWAIDLCEPYAGYSYSEMASAVGDDNPATCVQNTLKFLARKAGKPLVVFFDEVDCLSGCALVSFLRQLRSGKIASSSGVPFPVSIAIIGLRNMRDYRMRVRPDNESTGEASPFNVVTEYSRLRLFTEAEMRELYAQHTAATGQAFEESALRQAWEYSRGQPYLVNALARWCVDKIHGRDYSRPVTLGDMREAKEQIVRERATHLDSLLEKAKEPRVRPIVEQVILGGTLNGGIPDDDIAYAVDLGLLKQEDGALAPANPMYADAIGRYLTRREQDELEMAFRETPWATEAGLDMNGLLAAFQDFWRKNAASSTQIYDFHEAVPHLMLMAFLQRVTNGSGRINREMALGREALDLGIEFRGRTYAVEVKLRANYDRSHAAAHRQISSYMDSLGEREGWLVVFDPDREKPWADKVAAEGIAFEGRTIHLYRC